MTAYPIAPSRFPIRASKAEYLLPEEIEWLRQAYKEGKLIVSRIAGDTEYRLRRAA